MRKASLHEPPVAGDVDVQCRGERIRIDQAGRPADADAGTGHHDVDPAGLIDDPRDRPVDLLLPDDVARHADRVRSACRRCALHFVGLHIDQRDPMRPSEFPRDQITDALSGARQNGDRARPGRFAGLRLWRQQLCHFAPPPTALTARIRSPAYWTRSTSGMVKALVQNLSSPS